jgi:hypothetical protein
VTKTIEDVIAEAEIRDVHLRYCRGLDRRDDALLRGCFHPDATIVLHEELSVDAFLALGREMLSHYEGTWHSTSNQLVEVRGETAWAERYTISRHLIPADGSTPARDFVAYGRYLDRMERRDGEWRIAHREMVVDYTRMETVEPVDTPTGGQGARDRSDPSYAMWGKA